MKVILSPNATKQLQKLPRVIHPRILRKLDLLKLNPFAGKPLERNLRGHYSLRAWPYRILYILYKDQQIVLVATIEHRQGVYK